MECWQSVCCELDYMFAYSVPWSVDSRCVVNLISCLHTVYHGVLTVGVLWTWLHVCTQCTMECWQSVCCELDFMFAHSVPWSVDSRCVVNLISCLHTVYHGVLTVDVLWTWLHVCTQCTMECWQSVCCELDFMFAHKIRRETLRFIRTKTNTKSKCHNYIKLTFLPSLITSFSEKFTIFAGWSWQRFATRRHSGLWEKWRFS